MAFKTWRIVVPNTRINGPQKPIVLYNYETINIVLNLLGWILFTI